MNDTTATPVTTDTITDCAMCEGTGGTPNPCEFCSGTGKVGTSAAWQVEIDRVRTEGYNEVRATRYASSQLLDSFKTEVRDAVIKYATDQSLCTEGTNEFLTNLDLDPIETEFEVTWTTTYTVEVEHFGTVSAATEDDARELVDDDPDQYANDSDTERLVIDAVRNGHWEASDDGIEITDVQSS